MLVCEAGSMHNPETQSRTLKNGMMLFAIYSFLGAVPVRMRCLNALMRRQGALQTSVGDCGLDGQFLSKNSQRLRCVLWRIARAERRNEAEQ